MNQEQTATTPAADTPPATPPKETLQQKLAKAEPLLPVAPKLKLQLASREVNEAIWNTLKMSIFPGAKDDSIIAAIDYCRSRKLDVLKKPVHIVPVWVKQADGKGAMQDVIMPGISEIRVTAMRTGEYVGNNGEEFGPMVEINLAGKDYKVPEWCRYTVLRIVAGEIRTFVGPRVYWEEAYATKGKDTAEPNTMWSTRPRGQIAKCAEAAALRFAFPEALGSDYAAEELEGKSMTPRDVTPPATNVAADIAAALKGDGDPAGMSKVIDVEPNASDHNPIDQGNPEQSAQPQGDAATDNQGDQ